jgi:site-specific DNA recombinase
MPSATAPLQVTLYGRVSLLRGQELARSVDDQLSDLRAWADREGWHVYAVHRDDGKSASRYAKHSGRPGWLKVMADIRSGRVHAVLFWDFARGSRDDAETALLKETCAEHGVKIGYGGMLRDPSTADGAFSVGIDSLIAAKFSADLSEKRRRAADSLAAEGRPGGTVPYGYRRVIDSNTGRTIGREKHPTQAPIVSEIVRRLLAREPANAIADDLNRRGVPTGTGRTWRAGNLSKLARRAAYAGLRVHHGKVLDDVRGTWPALITETQHGQLVEMYADPARDKFRNPTHAKHLGSGIYRCGREGCNGRMRIVVEQRDRHGRARPASYSCRECYKLSRHQAPVDELVEAAVCAWLARPDVLAEISGDDPAVAEAAAEVVRLKTKLRAARAMLKAERLSLESFVDLEADLLPKIRAAEEHARPRHLPAALLDTAGPDAEAKWRALSIGEKRAIVAALVDVTILPASRDRRRFDRDLIRITPRAS